MKAQLKYAFRSGLSVRGPVFAVIFAMEFVFILLGSMALLPLSAKFVAVSLGGIAIAVMLAVNIYSDVNIFNRIFSPPEASLHALTPAPRRIVLLAGVIAAGALDIFTMTIVILGQIWLGILLAFNKAWNNIWYLILDAAHENFFAVLNIFLIVLRYSTSISSKSSI